MERADLFRMDVHSVRRVRSLNLCLYGSPSQKRQKGADQETGILLLIRTVLLWMLTPPRLNSMRLPWTLMKVHLLLSQGSEEPLEGFLISQVACLTITTSSCLTLPACPEQVLFSAHHADAHGSDCFLSLLFLHMLAFSFRVFR